MQVKIGAIIGVNIDKKASNLRATSNTENLEEVVFIDKKALKALKRNHFQQKENQK